MDFKLLSVTMFLIFYQCYCITLLLHYWLVVLLYYCIIVLLHHCIILYYCITGTDLSKIPFGALLGTVSSDFDGFWILF